MPKRRNNKEVRFSVCFSVSDQHRLERAAKIDKSGRSQFIRRATMLMVEEMETTLGLPPPTLPEPEAEPETQGTRDQTTRIVL